MKSIDKTLDVLEVFLNSKENKLRLLEIARLAGINKSTANRIVFDLTKRAYLQQAGKRGKYSLGPKFVKFGQRMDKRIHYGTVARPYLARLSKAVHECVLVTSMTATRLTRASALPSVRTGPRTPS